MTVQSARIDRVTTIAVIGLSCVFVALFGRVAQLQLNPGARLTPFLDGKLSRMVEPAVRGEVTDRRGRVLATTRFGWRAFVDPTRLAEPPDSTITSLAGVLKLPAEKVGEPILRVLQVNSDRRALGAKQPSDGAAAFVLAALRSIGMSRGPASDGDNPEIFGPMPEAKKPIRYVRIGGVMEEAQAERVRDLKLAGVYLERAPIRDYPSGAIAESVVGFVSGAGQGLAGAEHRYDRSLAGRPGRVSYVRDQGGHPIWIEPQDVQPARPGQGAQLSIDLEVQRILMEELTRGADDSDSAGARGVVLDTVSGEILAMADIVRRVPDAVPYPWADARTKARGHEAPPPATAANGKRFITIPRDEEGPDGRPILRRDRCVVDVYEPGSTFKPFIWSTITELGLARPDEVIDTENGFFIAPDGRSIKDVHPAEQMTWAEVLVHSSNIGMIKVGTRLGRKEMRDAVLRFGFGARTPAGLPGEAPGIVTSLAKWRTPTHTSVSFGHEISVTPLQMARAFSAFARPGELAGTLAPIRLSAERADDPERKILRRVLPVRIAALTRDVMSRVAGNMEARLASSNKDESEWAYSMFGKSGTAEIPLGTAPKGKRRPSGSSGYFDDQYVCSFIAGGPTESPRLVVLVVIDDPGPALTRARRHYGAYTAGPVTRRIMERVLTYVGAPPSRVIEHNPKAVAETAASGAENSVAGR